MRPLNPVYSALKDLRGLPDAARVKFGRALYEVQCGQTPDIAKPLKGLGPGVFELVLEQKGSAYRAAYVVRLRHAVYLLHVFSEEIEKRNCDTSTRHCLDQGALETCRRNRHRIKGRR